MMRNKKKIAILASGRGSNARKIVDFFKNHEKIEVSLILSNRTRAGVLDMARENGIPTQVINKKEFFETGQTLDKLKQFEIDYVILAGFLWLVPSDIIHHFNNKILNIHPSLLPKFGGKGMYGMNVHKAVKEANETESGITIHYVNTEFDQGEIIFQAICDLSSEDSPETIAEKVLALEHEHFASVIEMVILND